MLPTLALSQINLKSKIEIVYDIDPIIYSNKNPDYNPQILRNLTSNNKS